MILEKIEPIKDVVLVKNLEFGLKVLNSGIIVPDDDGKNRGIHPRWAQVFRVGPMVKELTPELKENNWILISHGRWSRGFEIKEAGQVLKVFRVDPKDILLVGEEPPAGYAIKKTF